MTVITHVRRKSRLSQMIDKAGGVSVGVALTRARENLAVLRPKALEEVSRHIDEMIAVPAPVDAADAIVRLEQVYRAANGVIDAAHAFDMTDICAVALSLCDVVDRVAAALEAGGHDIDWRVIRVHGQSLRLLFSLPETARAERDQIRAQLAEMITRKFAQVG
ncbi:MAG: chemotaxis protein CheE [Brevundimonas sp.]